VVNPANTLETVAREDLDPETEAIAHRAIRRQQSGAGRC
jgi:hypothetical protein